MTDAYAVNGAGEWLEPAVADIVSRLADAARDAGVDPGAVRWLRDATETVVADLQQPLYPHVSAWVTGWLAPTLEHKIATKSSGAGWYWCRQWWDHPEVLTRLYVLWRKWEVSRIEGSMSGWWVYHADPHLRAIVDHEGPFRKCHTDHTVGGALAADPAPVTVLAQFPEGPGEPENDVMPAPDLEAPQ